MNLNFRQGLVSYQSSGNQQQFLQPSSTSRYVDLVVTTVPTVVTFAHGESNYILKHDATVPNAWGPLPLSQTSFLYWDINLITGYVTYGFTSLDLVVDTVPPVDPLPGQMWFDQTTTKMKMRTAGANPWIDVVRVFAGVVNNGSLSNIGLFNNSTEGQSQVGLDGIDNEAGFILTDELFVPLKNSRGEFLTDAAPVRVRLTGEHIGVLTSPLTSFTPARASVPIPAFTVVSLDPFDSISPSSSNPAAPRIPVGIVLTDLATNEVGSILQAGTIVSDSWSWSNADVGKPLYIDHFGRLTVTRPSSYQVYRVGFVKNSRTIMFYVDAETQPIIVSEAGSIIDGVPPIVAVTTQNLFNETVTTISMHEVDSTHDGFLSAANFNVFSSLDGRLETVENDLLIFSTSKADAAHIHAISDITGLTAALVGKSDVTHNHDLLYSPLGHNHDSLYSPLIHDHQISDITNLQSALDYKINYVFPATAGNFPQLTAGGMLADSGFSSSNFAFASHQHTTADITNFVSSTKSTIVSTLEAGSNITLTYNSGPGTLTIDAAGGSTISAPVNEIVFGTGSSVTSSANLTYNSTTGALAISGSAGSAGQLLKSNGSTAAQTWQDPVYKPAPMTPITVTADVTVGSASHHNASFRSTSATAVSFNVPLDSNWPNTDAYWQPNASTSPMPPGGTFVLGKHGAGDVTLVPAVGVTINSPLGLQITKLHGKIALFKVSTNVWDVEGNLT